ncbi:hypothetical protein M9458_048535, partial [Cirrhinus mrigala]
WHWKTPTGYGLFGGVGIAVLHAGSYIQDVAAPGIAQQRRSALRWRRAFMILLRAKT